MRIEVIESLEGLESLSAEWAELHRRCPRATPFQSPQWLLPWTKHLYGGGEIWALAIRSHGELIGFAPLFCWGTNQSTVSFLGAGISDYGDILFAPEREEECVTALWDFCESRRNRWDLVDLQEVRSGSGLLEGQPAEPCSVCPVLDLSAYPGTMDRKHRTDVRRAQNKLRGHFELQFEMAHGVNFCRCFEEFFRLYEARWGKIEDSLQLFHRVAARRFLDAGLLRLCLVSVEAVPAAAIYSFTTGSVLYCYLSGFDPALAKLSPGAVLLDWLIEQAISEGLTAVDFLRQPEAYKYLWGARDTFNLKIVLRKT